MDIGLEFVDNEISETYGGTIAGKALKPTRN